MLRKQNREFCGARKAFHVVTIATMPICCALPVPFLIDRRNPPRVCVSVLLAPLAAARTDARSVLLQMMEHER
jgi:hypothetical protein